MFTSYPDRKVLKGAEVNNANALVANFMQILKDFSESITATDYAKNYEIKQFMNGIRCHVILEPKKSTSFISLFEKTMQALVSQYQEISSIIKKFYDETLKELTRYDRTRVKMTKPKPLDGYF